MATVSTYATCNVAHSSPVSKRRFRSCIVHAPSSVHRRAADHIDCRSSQGYNGTCQTRRLHCDRSPGYKQLQDGEEENGKNGVK